MKSIFHFILLMGCPMLWANVTLPSVFSNHMVLQRNSEVKIWGWADPNEPIALTTSWNDETYQTKATNQAYWEIVIKTGKEGGPYTLTIKGYNEVKLEDILLGEVWLCSGQSNMEMSAAWGIDNGDSEVKNANHPNIRFFNVPKLTATTPQNSLPAIWTACTPETMKHFSAVAYFFGRRLQEDLDNVPIGLIASSWGGTPAEVWIPETAFAADSRLAEEAKNRQEQQWGPHQPGRTFNAMIHPLVGFQLAGVLWYQGESNVGSGQYELTLSSLIRSWRESWQADFPFYFVQIAPYQYENDIFSGAVIRDAQRKVLQQVSHTGMVVTSDISPIDDIHPKDKKSVGERLAHLALKDIYKTTNAMVNGPLYKGMTIQKNKIFVAFDHAEGLYFKEKNSTLFEIAGADGIFYPAYAKINKNILEVYSTKVTDPVKVRYAWRNTDVANLFNNAGLPASTFVSE